MTYPQIHLTRKIETREIVNEFLVNDEGKPAGGKSEIWAAHIERTPEQSDYRRLLASFNWQKGPLRESGTFEIHGEENTVINGGQPKQPKQPNGVFVEDLIQIALDRLSWYQQGEFRSEYNEQAITHLILALEACNMRTNDRKRRGVEGTHLL